MGKGRRTTSSPSSLTTYSNRTAGPSTDGVRCGKWLLRSTGVRRRRGLTGTLNFQPSTPTLKRKSRAPSPTPSSNSFTGENSVEVANDTCSPIPMSSSGFPPDQLEDEFSDDDDLLKLETLDMMERDVKLKNSTTNMSFIRTTMTGQLVVSRLTGIQALCIKHTPHGMKRTLLG